MHSTLYNSFFIVCLCGSTKFADEFQKQNMLLTLDGKIVLSVGFFLHTAEKVHGKNFTITDQQKCELDELHKRKIDLADIVFVLNVNGYIGDSTRSEIEYASKNNKTIKYLENKGY